MSAVTTSILNLIQSTQPETSVERSASCDLLSDESAFTKILDEAGALIGEAEGGESSTSGSVSDDNVVKFPIPAADADLESIDADSNNALLDAVDEEIQVTQDTDILSDSAAQTSVNESIIANVDFSEVDSTILVPNNSSSISIDVEQENIITEDTTVSASESPSLNNIGDSSIQELQKDDSETVTDEQTIDDSSAGDETVDSDLSDSGTIDDENAESDDETELISSSMADAAILGLDASNLQTVSQVASQSNSQTNVQNSELAVEQAVEQTNSEQNKINLKAKVIVDSANTGAIAAAVSEQKQDIELVSSKTEQTKQSQETLIATSIKSEAEAENPTLKASERVAAAVKESVIQNTQDLSSRAKDNGIANLQALENMEVKVLESKSTGSNSMGSALAQGDASEQIIKMSLLNADSQDASLNNNFAVQLDKASSSVASNSTNASLVQNMPKELNRSDIMNQINSRLSEFHQTSTNKVTIALNPENLGRIHLEVINSHDGIIARMQTENPQVKELLERNMETLKNQLGSQGVNVNNIKVEYTNSAANNAMDFERHQLDQQSFQDSRQSKTSQNENNGSYTDGAEFQEDIADVDTEQVESQVIHNGKIDYKV